jgi:hypothetical protein
MNQTRFKQFLIEYTKNALDNSDGTPSGAENYLRSQKKPGMFSPIEKRDAFLRAKKIFSEMPDRPLWLVLKALGLTVEDLEN